MHTRKLQRGIATLWVLFSLVPIFAMVGLVTDVGWYYFTTEEARGAAEAAALAAIQSAMDSVKSGGTYTCGSGTLACQSTATGCATTVPSPITNNLQNGCAYAIANGFKNTGSQTVTIQANTTSPPPTVAGVSVNYWVTVRITQSNPLTFLGVLGGTTLGIGVRSTAAVIPGSTNDCVIALSPTASPGISASGSASIVANNCAMAVASNSSNALNVSGSASIQATAVDVVGSAKTSGSATITPSPTTVTSVTNPYASLAAPTFSTTCSFTNYTLTSGSATINPGTYCGGITTANGAITMNPGTYILYGGNLQSSGTGSFTGSGVFIYSTCKPSPCSGSLSGNMNLSGSSTTSLTAETSGAYSGILYFQDPTASTSGVSSVSGSSSTCFNGVIYVPESRITYSGGSSAGGCNTSLVANTITFSGSANLGSSTSTGSGPSAPTAFLIE